ncbi:MAG TPA: ABC transporter ATP-binding protein, partial [Acidocella sp.]|nr:ABC transporter ATP-binding protein [Acidocella sp.]
MTPVLEIRGLTVTLPRAGRDVPILEDFNLTIAPGRMLALVGESGAGKSVAALSVLRLLPPGAKISGEIRLDGTRVEKAGLQRLRGAVASMVFQDPLAALNPTQTVAAQIGEAWRVHKGGSKAEARAKALALLEEVGIADAATRLDDYPHQFSGGQRQRVMIAMALVCGPKLLIADEPTTGLDPLVAQQIMSLIAGLRRSKNLAVLFVTHDLSLVAEHADEVHVLYAGRSVEWGAAKEFFAQPRHPYSAALRGAVAWLGQKKLAAIPGQLPEPEARPPGCRFAPRCGFAQVDCTRAYPAPVQTDGTIAACLYPLQGRQTFTPAAGAPAAQRFAPLLEVQNLSLRYGKKPVLADVSLTVGQGECLGIVGESGSGKSSLGKAILQMLPYAGRVALEGQDFAALRGAKMRAARRRVQVVFQDPRESLNPRLRIGEIIAEPLRLAGMKRGEAAAKVETLLHDVGLSPALMGRLPGSVSGGQAQRIAIARALAAEPALLVLDEPTSALDVSNQALLLNLLRGLAQERGLSCLLISHDFAVVSFLSDRIAVLRKGRVVETGETSGLLAAPR